MDSKKQDIWVFLSHSNKDYEKVRMIRNMLEEKEYRPLLFFLKCLDEDTEIDTLIKREIDARNKFILCESENSRNSKWVQDEVEYIKSTGRMYETINLDEPLSKIKKLINKFDKRNSIYLSYTRQDDEFANTLYKELRRNDYKVFYEIDTISGNIINILNNAINDAIRHGYVISLISEHYLSSSFCLEELSYAYKKNNSNVIAIYLSNPLLLKKLLQTITYIPYWKKYRL